MSRRLREIYNEAVQERNRRLELDGVRQRLKLSVMNGILWSSGGCHIQFRDAAGCLRGGYLEAINNRINGTPDYYANALLQYQQGDELTVRGDGLAFGYAGRSTRPNASSHRYRM